MFSHLFQTSRRISTDDGLADNVYQRNRYRGIKMNEAACANNFESKVPLAVEFRFPALLDSAGNNIVNNLSFADRLFSNVTDVTPPQFNIVAHGRQVDVEWHHLEAPFVILLLPERLLDFHKQKRCRQSGDDKQKKQNG